MTTPVVLAVHYRDDAPPISVRQMSIGMVHPAHQPDLHTESEADTPPFNLASLMAGGEGKAVPPPVTSIFIRQEQPRFHPQPFLWSGI